MGFIYGLAVILFIFEGIIIQCECAGNGNTERGESSSGSQDVIIFRCGERFPFKPFKELKDMKTLIPILTGLVNERGDVLEKSEHAQLDGLMGKFSNGELLKILLLMEPNRIIEYRFEDIFNIPQLEQLMFVYFDEPLFEIYKKKMNEINTELAKSGKQTWKLSPGEQVEIGAKYLTFKRAPFEKQSSFLIPKCFKPKCKP